jgi:DNA-binding LacI/PurR family transcriptional regulator
LPTINDVARRAGVSPVTVSRVINETGNVSATTQAKVERAIKELGYVPSAMARSLRSKRTRTLALIVSDIANPFWTTVARGVEDAAQGRGYSVFLYNTDENPAKQQRYLDVVVAQGVDGVMIAPYDSDARNLAKLRRRNLPTVTVDRRIQGWDVDSVYCDSLSGAKALTQHLIDLGHRRIALISGPVNTSTATDRVAGYCLALTEAGIPVDPSLIKQGEYRVTSGEELTNRVLDEGLSAWPVWGRQLPSPPYLRAAPLVYWRLLSSTQVAVRIAVRAGGFRDSGRWACIMLLALRENFTCGKTGSRPGGRAGPRVGDSHFDLFGTTNQTMAPTGRTGYLGPSHS